MRALGLLVIAVFCASPNGVGAKPLSADRDGTTYAVSKIIYHNDGAYSASIEARYALDLFGFGTVVCQMFQGDGAVKATGLTDRVNLQDAANFTAARGANEHCEGYSIPIGTEVWGGIRIVYVKNDKNCQKNGSIFRYHPDGGTLEYVSKGTTEDNNRCRIKKKPTTKWGPAFEEDVLP